MKFSEWSTHAGVRRCGRCGQARPEAVSRAARGCPYRHSAATRSAEPRPAQPPTRSSATRRRGPRTSRAGPGTCTATEPLVRSTPPDWPSRAQRWSACCRAASGWLCERTRERSVHDAGADRAGDRLVEPHCCQCPRGHRVTPDHAQYAHVGRHLGTAIVSVLHSRRPAGRTTTRLSAASPTWARTGPAIDSWNHIAASAHVGTASRRIARRHFGIAIVSVPQAQTVRPHA